MKIHRAVLACGFAALLSAAFLISKSDAKPDEVTRIAPGVWFREGDLQKHGHCNNIIIEMQDYLIVVDANYPSGARLALADAKKVSPKPVKYVFDTHHHGDHAYGNPVFTQAGATTLAHIGVVQEMKRYEPKRWLGDAEKRADVRELNLPTAEPPKQTFDRSPFVLEDSSRRVEFHFFGWAHT
ncbi:MAG: MBL fold metallo-hydrolase, partial [Bryobacteraceae bacterium]